MHPRHTLDDFWKSVHKSDGCWTWQGPRNNKGYGWFHMAGGKWLAHRFSYELTYGSIPQGLFVLHRCDNPICVNPDHLFLGTQFDNIKDMIAKGRAKLSRPPEQVQGENNKTSKLTDSQIVEIRNLRHNGVALKALSQRFGVTVAEISLICLRHVWKHVP